ncbi:mechanosensitive ion channel family protein [Bacteriovoracales bacterium]|nr:mechanosensitive ion channel family protein [Bacteriovoracales bacterium]
MDFGLSNFLVEGSVQYKIGVSLLIIALFLFLRKGSKLFIDKKLKNKRSHYHVQRILDYFFWFLKIIFIGRLWFKGLGPLSTFFGLATAGLAVSLKDPLLNLIGWLTIIWKHPFSVGNRIEINGIKGDVVDINIFEFTLLEIGEWVDADQRTGRVVYIPNASIFINAQRNYDRPYPYIWDELTVTLTFQASWRKAKRLFEKILLKNSSSYGEEELQQFEKQNENFLFSLEDTAPKVFTSFNEKGIQLTLRYVTDPRKRRVTHQKIVEEILETFEMHDDLSFAFPSQNLIFQKEEKKKTYSSSPTL